MFADDTWSAVSPSAILKTLLIYAIGPHFLTQEFSTEDNADLFYEENMAKKRQDEDKARRAQLAVPGLVNPHDRPEDDMADL